jgi:hypothetical protein
MSILFYNFSEEIHLPDQVRELEIVIGIPFFRQALTSFFMILEYLLLARRVSGKTQAGFEPMWDLSESIIARSLSSTFYGNPRPGRDPA